MIIYEDLVFLIKQSSPYTSVSNELFYVENAFRTLTLKPPFQEWFTLFSAPPMDEGSCKWEVMFVVIVVVIIHFTYEMHFETDIAGC